jgi:hypothetical protein
VTGRCLGSERTRRLASDQWRVVLGVLGLRIGHIAVAFGHL